MKTIDLTPTWEQWMHTVMTIALRTKDPAKVLEPVAEDFKNVAKLADIGKRHVQEGEDLMKEALYAVNAIIKQHYNGPDGLDTDTYALASKLQRYLNGKPALDVHLNGDNDQPTTCPQCGSRTEFFQVGLDTSRQKHRCLDGDCGYEFHLDFE